MLLRPFFVQAKDPFRQYERGVSMIKIWVEQAEKGWKERAVLGVSGLEPLTVKVRKTS